MSGAASATVGRSNANNSRADELSVISSHDRMEQVCMALSFTRAGCLANHCRGGLLKLSAGARSSPSPSVQSAKRNCFPGGVRLLTSAIQTVNQNGTPYLQSEGHAIWK